MENTCVLGYVANECYRMGTLNCVEEEEEEEEEHSSVNGHL